MNKKLKLGAILMLMGSFISVCWRLHSQKVAFYDAPDPGFYLNLPGVILFYVGIDKESRVHGWLGIVGAFFLIIGCCGWLFLGENIGRLYYGDQHPLVPFILIGIGLLGLWILLKKRDKTAPEKRKTGYDEERYHS